MYLCWAAKGGSGTTTAAAALALDGPPTLLVDLDGDLPALLGLATPDTPGVLDWLNTDAPANRLDRLVVALSSTLSLLPRGHSLASPSPTRVAALAEHLTRYTTRVVIDAGTGDPHRSLLTAATHRWLVARPCYIGLLRAFAQRQRRPDCTPTGVVVVNEPGRKLGDSEIETSLGAPVVANIPLDPAVARATDAGLLLARLPGAFGAALRHVA